MTALTLPFASAPADVPVTRRLWQLSLALLAAAALTSLAALLDERLLGTTSVWMKPLKFQLALALQTATIAWALGLLAGTTRQRAMPRGLWLLRLVGGFAPAQFASARSGALAAAARSEIDTLLSRMACRAGSS